MGDTGFSELSGIGDAGSRLSRIDEIRFGILSLLFSSLSFISSFQYAARGVT